MDKTIHDLGRSTYDDAVGWSDMRRDKNGFIRLTPSASHVDRQVEQYTTDIKSLEAKLKDYRSRKAAAVEYQGSSEYKESQKQERKSKKNKKKRNTLLEMVFNRTLDKEAEEDDEDSDEENYRDSKKKRGPRKQNTTLDTTYGKRYSPIVSMLYDSIAEFDRIAASIEAELESPQLRSKNMYRSTQIGNLLTAKDKRLSAIKELSSVATTLSNLEYKREKDKKAEEGTDTTKAISNLGAKFLRGGFDYDMVDLDGKKSGKKKGKKGGDKKDRGGKNQMRGSFGRPVVMDLDDDDDDDYDRPGSVKRAKNSNREEDDRELAAEFAKMLENRKDEFHFTPHERFMNMEGKYQIVVAGDSLDMENTWKFVAVDTSTGKAIKNFKDDYPGLLPKKKQCRMSFDLNRLKATDRNSGKTYEIILSD